MKKNWYFILLAAGNGCHPAEPAQTINETRTKDRAMPEEGKTPFSAIPQSGEPRIIQPINGEETAMKTPITHKPENDSLLTEQPETAQHESEKVKATKIANESWKIVAEAERQKRVVDDLITHAEQELRALRAELAHAQHAKKEVPTPGHVIKKYEAPLKNPEGILDGVEEAALTVKNIVAEGAEVTKEVIVSGAVAVKRLADASASKTKELIAEARAEHAQDRAAEALYEGKAAKERLVEITRQIQQVRSQIEQTEDQTKKSEQQVYGQALNQDLSKK